MTKPVGLDTLQELAALQARLDAVVKLCDDAWKSGPGEVNAGARLLATSILKAAKG